MKYYRKFTKLDQTEYTIKGSKLTESDFVQENPYVN